MTERGRSKEARKHEYADLAGKVSTAVRERLAYLPMAETGFITDSFVQGKRMVVEGFSPGENLVRFSVWYLDRDVSERVSYFINGTSLVKKGGLVSLDSETVPYAVILYTDEKKEPEEDEFIKPTIEVGLEELRLVSKLAQDPKANFSITDQLPHLPH